MSILVDEEMAAFGTSRQYLWTNDFDRVTNHRVNVCEFAKLDDQAASTG